MYIKSVSNVHRGCWQWRLVVKMAGRAAKFHLWLNIQQGCQTYSQRDKTGPLRGWIRLAGWFR